MKVQLVRLPDGTLTFRVTIFGVIEENTNRRDAISLCCKRVVAMRKVGAL